MVAMPSSLFSLLVFVLLPLSLFIPFGSPSCPLSFDPSSPPPPLLSSLSLRGAVPHTGHDFFLVPFDVTAAVAEIQIQHNSVNSTKNILDFGLIDPAGVQRGWGGGTTALVIVNEYAASPSYSTGPLLSGQWSVLVGLPQIVDAPGWYNITICLLGAPTLPPQTTRTPYTPLPPLIPTAQWFAGTHSFSFSPSSLPFFLSLTSLLLRLPLKISSRLLILLLSGDFHVHSFQSGDATPSLDQIASFASQEGLDFVVITDHNVITSQDYFTATQQNWPTFLFVPGMEWTSYYGHANLIGATKWVDAKIGYTTTIEEAVAATHSQGALFSLNHVDMYKGLLTHIPNLCIGCTWDFLYQAVDSMEIGIEGLLGVGGVYDPRAIDWWDHLCSLGYNVTAIGGSDDHHGGDDPNSYNQIGHPTTMVWADNLSVSAIVDGVRSGRTVVKLRGPTDPMIDFSISSSANGSLSISVVVTLNPKSLSKEVFYLTVVRNNIPQHRFLIHRDPFEWSSEIDPPLDGRDRWRCMLFALPIPTHLIPSQLEGGVPITITSHRFVYPNGSIL